MVYLDNSATTPLDPRVLAQMQPWLGENYGNASSIHRFGRACQNAIEQARCQVATLVGARPDQVIFTPSGTTANNLALLGYLSQDRKRKLWLSGLEHSSIQSIAASQAELDSQWFAVSPDGLADIEKVDFSKFCTGDLMTLMLANNETGVIEPVAEMASKCRQHGGRFHCDAVQAVGKLPVDFEQLQVDSLTLTAHKLYGPLGAAALVVRNCADLNPIVFGGGHECGLFSGTLNTPAIVGLGHACHLAYEQWQERKKHIDHLQIALETFVEREFQAKIYGQNAPRVSGISMFSLAGIHGETLVMQCDKLGYAISSGSACHSTVTRPSPVLQAMNVVEQEALCAVRVSIGKDNTVEHITDFCHAIRKILAELC